MSNNPIINKTEKQDNENYQKAMQDALKLRDSMNKLTCEQCEDLICELVKFEGVEEIFNEIKYYL